MLGSNPLERLTPEMISRVMSKLGRKGGKSKSKAKVIAARKNGKKGGRPRKSK